MNEFKQYQRKGFSEMRPYIKGEDVSSISIASVDDPETDLGMVARNPKNHADQWYVARKYFEENLELVSDDRYISSDFGMAISALREGYSVARKGWNGKGIFIKLHIPTKHSKMTQPYIYIVTTGLQTDNQDAPKGLVPWLASQTDVLSDDWYIVEDKY